MSLAECYRVLELRPGSSLRQIHLAYKRLAMRYHPDTASQGLTEQARFCRVTEAYQALRAAVRQRGRPDRFGLCHRCRSAGELFPAAGGSRYCADCLLPGRRRTLPLPRYETIRCTATIVLQLLAAYCVTVSALTGDWHHGVAAALCAVLAMVVLGICVRTADVITR